MSKYSLDDILAEFDKKGNKKAPENLDADDILKSILGEEIPSQSKKKNKEEKRPPDETRSEPAAAKEPDRPEMPAPVAEATNDTEDVFERIREERIAREKRLADQAEEENRRKAEQRRREDEFIASIKEENIRKENAKKREEKKKAEIEKRRQRDLEEKKRREEERRKAREQKELEEKLKEQEEEQKRLEEQQKAAKELEEQERLRSEQEEEKRREEMLKAAQSDASEKLFATKSIVMEDSGIELPSQRESQAPEAQAQQKSDELSAEEVRSLRQQMVDANAHDLLIKESELEDPDDFLTALNPYDLSRKSEITQMIETIPSENLSGDTQAIAGNELKELVKSSAKNDTRSFEQIIDGSTRIMPELSSERPFPAFDPDKTFELADDIKEFVPKKGHDTREVERKKTPEEEELLRSINRTLEQNRLEEKRDTAPVISDTGPYDKITLPTRKVGMSKDELPRTGEIPLSDPELADRKAKELEQKKKRRLSDFVFVDGEDDYDLTDSESEYEEPDDGTGLTAELYMTHRGLRMRAFALAFLVILLFGAQIVQNILTDQRIGLFGNELGFLDSNGMIFVHLIIGVIGAVICKSVILSGIPKLFTGKADCDSVCTVSIVTALIAASVNLVDTNDLQLGHSFLYVSVALFGLLFDTFGKISMIARARSNYRFMTSDAPKYYAEVIDGQSEASAFTKGVLSELPYLVTMRKTELLTEFLKKSYCDDKADLLSRKLVPASVIAAIVLGLTAYFVPNGFELNGVRVLDNNLYWSISVAAAAISVMSPFSMMFMVNNPLRRATKATSRSGSRILGYTSAEEFGNANSVIVDASVLFPPQTVECMDLKTCRMQNSGNSISLDTAIILAASIAVKTGSVMAGFFFDMLDGKEELLEDLDGCIYEDNMGSMGWYGTKRVMLGNRDHMKHHGIKIPELGVIAKYCRNGSETVYLAVNNELVTVFFVRLNANPEIRESVSALAKNDIALVIKTTDSLITPGKISDLFDIEPGRVKIINSDLHRLFSECTRYTADGSGAFSCTGTFPSLSRGLIAAKKLLKDFRLSQTVLLTGVIAGLVAVVVGIFSAQMIVFSPLTIICWNTLWLLIMLLLQSFRRY